MVRDIAQLGEGVLRGPCHTVEDFDAPDVQQLVDDLIDTLTSRNGLGLAAPQVFRPLRILVACFRPTPRFPDTEAMPTTAFINPQILARSDAQIGMWEMCYSVPGIRGLVPRSREIGVEFTTREGLVKTRVLRDLPAVIFQHEFDHLQGLLYLDRIRNTQDLIAGSVFTERDDLHRVYDTFPVPGSHDSPFTSPR
ncbi:MAG: peptide deformylase [Lentisphaerae bacterium]|jgi:peptide deformylase|nr:peptide deformylase [Lentisphaerota bacterium]MBT5610598.1 peptide deformylase [Lentisphaerota bacterium]MBT7054493.1 peptide deformylase [Lentisphaerota bacterium]MBT7842605.1 peptide deformylase [Lentisphaerota bacterium]